MSKRTALFVAAALFGLAVSAPQQASAQSCTECDMEGDCRFNEGEWVFCFPSNPGCDLIGECDALSVAGLTAAGGVPVTISGMVIGEDRWLKALESEQTGEVGKVIRRSCDGAILHRWYTPEGAAEARRTSQRIII